jgi:hypothetical protein
MKYTFGVLCILAAAWLIYRGIVHRRDVLAARAALPPDHPEPQLTRRQQGLHGMRTGLGPLFVMLIVLAGIVLTGLWFVVDQGQVFSGLDILGFMIVNLAYAFWMFVHMRHSRLGLSPAT